MTARKVASRNASSEKAKELGKQERRATDDLASKDERLGSDLEVDYEAIARSAAPVRGYVSVSWSRRGRSNKKIEGNALLN